MLNTEGLDLCNQMNQQKEAHEDESEKPGQVSIFVAVIWLIYVAES